MKLGYKIKIKKNLFGYRMLGNTLMSLEFKVSGNKIEILNELKELIKEVEKI
jgi:hypothetical protein